MVSPNAAMRSTSKLAFQAQQMHGAYNIWDLGDRPTRLIAEIQVAKEKKKNGTAVASRKPSKREAGTKKEAVAKSMPESPDREKARKMLKDAGVSVPVKFDLAIPAGATTFERMAPLLKNELKRAGFDMNIVPIQPADVLWSTGVPRVVAISATVAGPQ